jgi:undecaprenyl-diphosphatase
VSAPLGIEARLLLAIHAVSSPALDALFRVSDWMGTPWLLAPMVLGLALVSLRKGQRGEAALWVAAGLSVLGLQEVLKGVVARPRPSLWPPIILAQGYSFPSGHALATAALYPLAARQWARTRASRARAAFVAAVLLVLFVGFGRLYLGVHWPTDVLAGWTLGSTLAILGVRLRRELRD